MNARDLPLGCIPYGTVYLVDPELAPEERRRDLETIQGLGFNTVVIWPPVSRWEADPPGDVAFDSVDEVMDACAELGLRAILELQGQNTSWQEAPECYPTPEGTPRPNARDIPINDPQYRKLTCDYIRAVAEHFRGHPALLAYDLFNEVGNLSRDPHTITEFIRFLRRQYDSDVRALNCAWGSFFADFAGLADVPPNFQAWRWSSCVAERDWQRFRAVNFAECLAEWRDAVREVDPDVPVLADVLGADTLHNRAGDYFGITDRRVADRVDVLGLSCYGNMLGERWWECDAWRWAQWWRASLSAARGKQAMISELMTQNRTLFPWEASSMTDQVRLWSYQAVFHGIRGLIYWKFRPFRKGLQVAGRGLTDFAGRPNRHGRQAAETGAFVARHADTLAGLRPDAAGCAVLHDPNTQDVYQAIQPRAPDFYTDAHGGIFRGFWTRGVSPLVVEPEDLLDGPPSWLRLLAVPCNVSVSRATAEALAAFVRSGGALLTEGRFALLDEDGRLRPHVPGGGLAEVLGFEETDFTARMCGSIDTSWGTLALENDYFQTLALADDTDVLLRTRDGTPALVARRVGRGMAVHAAMLLGRKIHHDAPGALGVFAQAFDAIQDRPAPAVPVLSKGGRVDVSVLVDEGDRPRLVGIVNYHEDRTSVQLGWPRDPRAVEGDANASAERCGETLVVRLPARGVAAVWL